MKWVIVTVAILVGVPVMLALIGSLIPKGHTASRSATFRQPPEAVWAVITDFEALPSWRSDVKSVERQADRNGHPVWVEVRKTGRMPYEVEVLDPPRRMVTRIADDELPFGGTWTYVLEPVEGGCRLTLTENGEIDNPLFRVMARFLFGYHATMEAYLKSLGSKFGEEVHPAPAAST